MAVSTVLQMSHPALAMVQSVFATMAGLLGVGIPLAFSLGQVNLTILFLGGFSSGVAGGIGVLAGGRGALKAGA